jgi:hypothetical protein
MINKCKTCNKKIFKNPRFILMVADVLGYSKFNFCKEKCFLDYIFKNHRKKFEKRYL